MNKVIILLFAAFIVPFFAQNVSDASGMDYAYNANPKSVIVPGEDLDVDFAIGPALKYTLIKDKSAAMIGLQAGIFFNRRLSVFIEGFRLSNELQVKTDSVRDLHMAYLAFGASYIFLPEKPIHFSLGGSIGAGDIVFHSPNKYYNDYWYGNHLEPDAVMLFEPEANIIFNVTDFIKVSLGGNYRFMYGVVLNGLTNANTSAPSFVVRLLFGSF